MLRVLLIDDEPLALEGLKLLIDWPSEGFEVCSECASANEALAKLPVAKPDLIVTDIRMPGMNGLELVKTMRQAGFDGQFVIVSGYSDFEYAKKALQLGVAGYLLKPVEPADAASVLAHVRHKLIDREATSNQRPKAVHHAITALLTQEHASASDLPQTARWMVATWGAPLPHPAVQALLSLFAKDMATAHIVEDKEYLVLRLAAGDHAPSIDKAKALLASHHRDITVGKPADTPEGLFVLRRELSDTLDDACRGVLTEHVQSLVRAVSLRQAGECATLCQALETLCASYGAEAITRARRQLLTSCTGMLSDRADAPKAFLQSQDADFLTMCLLAIKLLAPELETVSDRVERYAKEHSGEHITVSSAAAALGYNPTYLGRKYCEERGMGFREWLAGQRMQQAAALLRTTDQSVISIAKAVGYEHYKRFLRHFKRRYGIAPDHFRKKKP